ncbi:MAG TPA: type II toxin-antitoxin system HicA family toxin [bacterium]|nr:type II toxin-antitoxin system HicA family toxin [bacterium]HOM25944.1 type II toxin-antitoxin system HicA family toxin [bacterium]
MKKVIKFDELVRKFRKLGYEGPFSGGKHLFMKKGSKKVHIPNPHKSKDIHISLLKEILKCAGIDEKEWEDA